MITDLTGHEVVGNYILYGAILPDMTLVVCKRDEDIPDEAVCGLLVDRLTDRVLVVELEPVD